ncbi:unnamed protein product [Clonostachys rosea]|uniref:Nephrocystin 3-like N-terminal domain-containing protein n=1 Tax=Bionectria ochroleuca TaxID=29856 RepID=A0ABY6UPB6_BIOOC|nr:unnamed protein product [Clonostachys rosea]
MDRIALREGAPDADEAGPLGDFEIVQRQDACLPQEELDRIVKWLDPTAYLSETGEFKRHLAAQTPGTSIWLSQTDKYKTWIESAEHPSLWIKAVPGAGKSVMAASLTRHLQQTSEPGTPVLFFFFRHIVRANRTPRALVRDWLAQALPHSLSLQTALKTLSGSTSSHDAVPDSALWDCLRDGLASAFSRRVFCVVDALDEMEAKEDDPFLGWVNALGSSNLGTVKLLMTGRPKQYLQSWLRASSIVHLNLEEEKIHQDIQTFVKQSLCEPLAARQPAQLEDLVNVISQRSGGLFLYARLMVDQILPTIERGEPLDAEKMPMGLQDMYHTVLCKQAQAPGIDTDMQVFLLGCVTHSFRPLRLRELAALLQEYISNKNGTSPSLSDAKLLVKQACGPLLDILDDETVQVLHHSMTEFLLGERSETLATNVSNAPPFPIISSDISHKCLAMISLSVLVGNWKSPLERARYAADYWAKHLQCISHIQDPDLIDSITSFCQDRDGYGSGPLKDWAQQTLGGAMIRCRSSCLGPLSVAGYIGNIGWCKTLIESGCRTQPQPQPESEPDRDTEHQWPCVPLWWAVLGGSVAAVQYLLPLTELERLKRDDYGMYCWTDDLVETAIAQGQVEILDLLLKAGCGPLGFLWKRNIAETHLPAKKRVHRIRKAMKRYQDVRCLAVTLPYLEKDVQAELLCIFAEQARPDAVECILDNTEVDANGVALGKTALYSACQALRLVSPQKGADSSRGYESVLSRDSIRCVELLLARGASIESRTTVPLTKQSISSDVTEFFEEKERLPLHALVGSWYDGNSDVCEDIFNRLVDAGADLEARDGTGDTPLFCLFPRRHAQASIERPLRFLLEKGADASARDADGSSLLHRALVYHRSPRIVQMLVDYGVDVNALAPIMMHGEKKNHPAIGLIFTDRCWYLVLHKGRYAEEKKSVKDWGPENKKMVQILVGAGANIDADGSNTLLLKALPFCDTETLKLLLGSRKHPETAETVLYSLNQPFVNTSNERPLADLVALLVAAGASLETKTAIKGRTPLLMAVNNLEMVRVLLEAGADASAVDDEGNGVLHAYVGASLDWQRKAPEVANLRSLIDLGFDPRGVNEHGDTLLHMAAPLQDPEPLITALLDYGTSLNSRNYAGMTVFHTFMRSLTARPVRPRSLPKPSERLSRLLQFFKESVADLDIDIADNDGLTPLHYAAMSMSPASVQCMDALFSFGASITATDKVGKNALHLACIARNTSSLLYLLDRAADDLLETRDSLGRTPLFYACSSGLAEAVGILLNAGADTNARDSQHLGCLHACAEFMEEQARWDKVELVEVGEGNKPSRQLHTDPYRPYYIEQIFTEHERRQPDGSLPEPGLFDRVKLADHRAFHAPWLETPNEAIYSVVQKLMAAGAVPDDAVYEAAQNSKCGPILVALMDSNSSGQVASSPRNAVWPGVVDESVMQNPKERDALLRNPLARLKDISLDDIDWLLRNDANLTTPFRTVPFKASWNMKTNPVGGKFIPQKQPSFLQTSVLNGSLSFVKALKQVSRCYDSPGNLIDKWAVEMTATFKVEHRKLTSSSTLNDLVKSSLFCREIQPLVYLACMRRHSNLEMLKVLVEYCGVDCNSREIRVDYFTTFRPDMGALTALGYMAMAQEYWHLSAIRYLVGKGADVNIRDLNGDTPLLLACTPEVGGRWRKDFVRLLLELGADPNLANLKGTRCLDIVTDSAVADMLAQAGASLETLRQGLVHKAIVTMDVELMKHAINYGADMNAMLDRKKYPWRDVQPPMNAPYPLVGAFATRLQRSKAYDVVDDPDQRRKRISMIRCLLMNGADPCLPLETKYDRVSSRPFLHMALARGQFDSELLDVFFEPQFANKLDLETRDAEGRTPLLSLCACTGPPNHYHPPKFDVSEVYGKLTGLGADTTPTDNEGNNLLHILLKNHNIATDLIVSILSDPLPPHMIAACLQSTKPTTSAADQPGYTPFEYALQVLRPAVVSRLIDLGGHTSHNAAIAATSSIRPSPAHQVLAQCFDTRLRPGDDRSLRDFSRPTEPDHTAQCLALRARLIECGQWDPNAVDEAGMPAWFAFVLNREPSDVRTWAQRGIPPPPAPPGNSLLSELPGGEQGCVVLRFWDAFLGDQWRAG